METTTKDSGLCPKAITTAQRVFDIPWHYDAKPDEWKRDAAKIIQIEVRQIVKLALDGAIHASKHEPLPPDLEEKLKGWFPERADPSNG